MPTRPGPAFSNDRILIIDSEQMSCELLQYKFQEEGFSVDICHSGNEATKFDLATFNLFIVDLMDDPELNGLKFTSLMKTNPETYGIPIIILSAQASKDDIVNGLDAGADDYLSKPFSTRELIARVRSVLRRGRMSGIRRPQPELRYKGLHLDLGSGDVKINDTLVSLSRTEFLILAMLLRNRNQFVSRAAIQDQAWENSESVSDRAVDTNISRLRKKIGDYGRNIINRPGHGYAFAE